MVIRIIIILLFSTSLFSQSEVIKEKVNIAGDEKLYIHESDNGDRLFLKSSNLGLPCSVISKPEKAALTFIFGGQSGNDGAVVNGNFPTGQLVGDMLTLAESNEVDWLQPIDVANSGNGTKSGPIFIMSDSIQSFYPYQTYGLKNAFSGQSITTFIPPLASDAAHRYQSKRRNEEYFIDYVKSTGVHPYIVYQWDQGQADALTSASANAYAANLDIFVQDRRDLFGDVYFITTTIAETAGYPFASVVNQAFFDKANSDSLFDVIDMRSTNYPDGVHTDYNGLDTLMGRSINLMRKNSSYGSPLKETYTDCSFEYSEASTIDDIGLIPYSGVLDLFSNQVTWTGLNNFDHPYDNDLLMSFRLPCVPLDSESFTVEFKMRFETNRAIDNLAIDIKSTGSSNGYQRLAGSNSDLDKRSSVARIQIRNTNIFLRENRLSSSIVGTFPYSTPNATDKHYRVSVSKFNTVTMDENISGVWTNIFSQQIAEIAGNGSVNWQNGGIVFATQKTNANSSIKIWDIKSE